jgi:hypothetical protein
MNILEETQFIFLNHYNKFLKDPIFNNLDIDTEIRIVSKLNELSQSCFKFGLEHGKEEALINIRMMENDFEDDTFYRETVRKQKKGEAQKIIDGLHQGENILEYKDRVVARKKRDMIQQYAKYYKIPIKFKQQGNLLYLLKE